MTNRAIKIRKQTPETAEKSARRCNATLGHEVNYLLQKTMPICRHGQEEDRQTTQGNRGMVSRSQVAAAQCARSLRQDLRTQCGLRRCWRISTRRLAHGREESPHLSQ